MRTIYWSHTYKDLQTIISIKSQEMVAVSYQQYESLRLVVAEALGGKKTNHHRVPTGGGNYVESFDELAKAFSEMGGMVG